MYSDKYTLANDPESNCKNARSKREPFTEDQLLNITITSLLMGLVIFAIVLVYVTGRSVVIPSNLHLSEQVRKSWAHYSPYTPAGTYAVPSEGCAVKQVNIVSHDRCFSRCIFSIANSCRGMERVIQTQSFPNIYSRRCANCKPSKSTRIQI